LFQRTENLVLRVGTLTFLKPNKTEVIQGRTGLFQDGAVVEFTWTWPRLPCGRFTV